MEIVPWFSTWYRVKNRIQSRNCIALKMLVKTKNNRSTDITLHWLTKLFSYNMRSLFNFAVLLTSFFSLLLFCCFRALETTYYCSSCTFTVTHSLFFTCISYLVLYQSRSFVDVLVSRSSRTYYIIVMIMIWLDLAGYFPGESCSHVTSMNVIMFITISLSCHVTQWLQSPHRALVSVFRLVLFVLLNLAGIDRQNIADKVMTTASSFHNLLSNDTHRLINTAITHLFHNYDALKPIIFCDRLTQWISGQMIIQIHRHDRLSTIRLIPQTISSKVDISIDFSSSENK